MKQKNSDARVLKRIKYKVPSIQENSEYKEDPFAFLDAFDTGFRPSEMKDQEADMEFKGYPRLCNLLMQVPESMKLIFVNPYKERKLPDYITQIEQLIARFEKSSAIIKSHQNTSFTRKDLPLIIQGRETRAQHDTGAEGGNFITCDLASELGLRIRNQNSDRKSFQMGNGRVMRAMGRVKASCAFAGEPQTKYKCWFYVFENLASPLIMGSQFLDNTRTMSLFRGRLEDRLPCNSIIPMVNLIGSTQQSKRRLAAFIDGHLVYVNADSGSHLDLMSSKYVRYRGYKIDRRKECRKRVRVADTTVIETIGQVEATLTLEDGCSYLKTFDVLPGLPSEVLIGESTLEEISAFTSYASSFVDVVAGERHFELSVLSYLGKVNSFLAHTFRKRQRGVQAQPQPSLAKQQDNAMMEAMLAEDLEAERNRRRMTRDAAAAVAATVASEGVQGSG